MTPAAIIKGAAADGVRLALSLAGTVKAAGSKDAVSRWLPIIRAHKPLIVAELQQAANEDAAGAARGWLLHFSDSEPRPSYFTPAATHAEALAAHPGALAAEPIAETPKRPATDSEAAELRKLVASVYQADTDVDHSEALAAALADPDAALACYRAIAAERAKDVVDPFDDRRTCQQCANLRRGVCTVAKPAGPVVAERGYRPSALFLENPHRCEGYQPGGLAQ